MAFEVHVVLDEVRRQVVEHCRRLRAGGRAAADPQLGREVRRAGARRSVRDVRQRETGRQEGQALAGRTACIHGNHGAGAVCATLAEVYTRAVYPSGSTGRG